MFICDKNEIGLRLKHLREKVGLSQDAVAKELGLSRELVSKWENGDRDPNIQAIANLSELYHSTCDYIITGIETENVELSRDTGFSDAAISSIMKVAKHQALFNLFGQRSFLTALIENPDLHRMERVYQLYLSQLTNYIDIPISNEIRDKFRSVFQVEKGGSSDVSYMGGDYDDLIKKYLDSDKSTFFNMLMEMIADALREG